MVKMRGKEQGPSPLPFPFTRLVNEVKTDEDFNAVEHPSEAENIVAAAQGTKLTLRQGGLAAAQFDELTVERE